MTINRLIDIANLRQEIAIAAARMIAEEGTSYEVAKRKAARQILGNSRITGEILPDNMSIEKEVKLYNELFLADSQPARLLRLRTLSLKLMQELEEFNPYITGAILNGTGGEHSDIHIQLFTDNVEEVERFLLNKAIDFDVLGIVLIFVARVTQSKRYILCGTRKLLIYPYMNLTISANPSSFSAQIFPGQILTGCSD